MRKLEKSFAPPSVTAPALETKDYEFVTITPMFGGGTVAAEIDEDRPVHVTSIRGSLREWWRRLYGEGRHNEELFKAESCIWGATDQASVVKVELVSMTASEKIATAEIIERNGKNQINTLRMPNGELYPQYALFPFQGEVGDPFRNKPPIPPKKGWDKGLSFTIRIFYNFAVLARDKDGGLLISADQVREQVKNTLIAWANFGGIGARTRRGLGALYCNELAFENEAKTADFVQKFLQPGNCTSLISPDTKQSDSLAVWADSINTMSFFRQGKEMGRNKGSDPTKPKKLGRSFWPEPDEIRRKITPHAGQSYRHEPGFTKVHAFPRARFGLPIIFHFQGSNEPKDVTLLPAFNNESEPKTRMASPILIRPLKFKNTAGFRTIVLVFQVPHFDKLVLQQNNKTVAESTDSTVVANFGTDKNSPLNRYSEADSVKAFIAYLRQLPQDRKYNVLG